jgi:hypothetical protein
MFIEIDCCVLTLVFTVANALQLGENVAKLDSEKNKDRIELQKELTWIAPETKVIIVRKIIVYRNKLKMYFADGENGD